MSRLEPPSPPPVRGHPGPARLLLGLLLAIVALAPLPLASSRPVAWLALAVLVGLLLLAWTGLVLARRVDMAVPPRALLPVLLPLALAFAWAGLQASGLLPVGQQHPLWQEAQSALGVIEARSALGVMGAGGGHLSLDPQATWDAMLRNAAYAGIFFLALQLCRDPAHAATALSVLAAAGTAYAAYGLFVYFSGTETILWMPKWAYEGDLTATFVNRNAYGAYAAIGLLCVLARLSRAVASLHSGRSLRLRDLADRLAMRTVPLLVAAFLLATALLLTHSRGALISAILGLAFLLAGFVAARLLSRRKALLLVLASAPLLLALVLFSGGETLDRLAVTPDTVASEAEARTPAYRMEIEAIAQAPWTGYGLGSFLSAFRQFRDPALPGALAWDYAHNVHLELLMDLGIPGALLVYAGFAAMAFGLARGLRRRRQHQVYPALALACLLMAGVHGMMDFSPQTPAVAATLALILGIGIAQCRRRTAL